MRHRPKAPTIIASSEKEFLLIRMNAIVSFKATRNRGSESPAHPGRHLWQGIQPERDIHHIASNFPHDCSSVLSLTVLVLREVPVSNFNIQMLYIVTGFLTGILFDMSKLVSTSALERHCDFFGVSHG